MQDDTPDFDDETNDDDFDDFDDDWNRPTVNIPVQFTGTVSVQVPDHLSSNDAKLLATKIALARILATTNNPDAPEDDAISDYSEGCSHHARKTAEQDWDQSEVQGVSGSWITT
jgi:hypothetical protein